MRGAAALPAAVAGLFGANPTAQSDDFQRIDDLQVETRYSYERAADKQGSRVVHLRGVDSREPAITAGMQFEAARREHVRPDRLVSPDDRIRQWARGVVEAAGARSDLEATRWAPVDASEAAKDPDRRQYFFGAHDANRVEFAPEQREAPLNYFVYPYVELDSARYTGIENSMSYKDQ